MSVEQPSGSPDYFADPLQNLDHSRVVKQVLLRLGAQASVSIEGNNIYCELLNRQRDVIEWLMSLGAYHIPLDDDGKLTKDIENARVYASALVIAIETLDIICHEINVSQADFYKSFRSSGTIRIIDTKVEALKDATESQKHAAIADGIIDEGDRLLGEIPAAYCELIETVGNFYPEVQHKSYTFKANYGFLLGNGLEALRKYIHGKGIAELVDGTDSSSDVEQDKTEPPEIYMLDDDIHELLAESLDTEIFYRETEMDKVPSAAEYLGELVEKNLRLDAEFVDAMNQFATLLYSADIERRTPDYSGQEFFFGLNLGKEIVTRLCAANGFDGSEVARCWKEVPLHQKLIRKSLNGEDVFLELHTALVSTASVAMPSKQYQQLLDKICVARGYEKLSDESMAFQNGAQYMLITGLVAMQDVCVEAQIVSIDQELEELFRSRGSE